MARLNAAGSALDYATFLGGSNSEGGSATAVDGAGRATVTGRTYSSDFPIPADPNFHHHTDGNRICDADAYCNCHASHSLPLPTADLPRLDH